MYIGCTINIQTRWREHKQTLKLNKHVNRYLQRAWNKYGKDAFKFERVEICEESELLKREHYWCNLLNVHDKH